MKKNIFRLFVVCIAMCLTSVCFLINANAASASLFFSDPTVTVGNNVSIVVTVKGDDIAAYQMNISYDTSYLQYVSAKGNTGNFSPTHTTGVVRVVDYLGSGSTSKMTFTLTFKALKTGTTKLTPSGYSFSSGSADAITPGAIGDSTVTIKPVPEASGDCTLKGLSVGGTSISPAFNAKTTQYTASVDFPVQSVAVTASKNHKGASVYVSGNDALVVGENTVTVTVTAENGAKKTYTIKITRAKNPLSTDIFASLGENVKGEIAAEISADIVPTGFTLTKLTIGEKQVDAVLYDERALPAVYILGNDTIEQNFYYLNMGDMTLSAFDYIGITENWLNVLDINMAEIPEGYEVGTFDFGGFERSVFIPSNAETPNHCLVYAIGRGGEKNLYMYDPVEKTYQRFSFAEMGKPEETTAPIEDTDAPGTDAPDTQKDEQKNDKKYEGLFDNPVFKWSFVIIAALIVILSVVGIVLVFRGRYL
ncbi:MAG: cadherin-like beta sandwich domain-containing protein [Clostridia bacterium]|nr:cadherin-like beta sandwich domain-containing protein [Clostridia bacterium]